MRLLITTTLQAIAEHDKGNHKAGESLASTAQNESANANKHSANALAHRHL